MKEVICSFFLILFILPYCIFADEYGITDSGKNVLLKDNGTWEYVEGDRGIARVEKIVDGDTIKINFRGNTENIRLIGIDTPGSRANSKAKKDAEKSGQDVETITAMGKEATNYVKSIVNLGDNISIEFDVQLRDMYGRLLGYIYLKNGEMLNENIVSAGYANVMTIPPNVKYQNRFLAANEDARENNRGLWKK